MAFEVIDTKSLKEFQEEGKKCVELFAEIRKDFEEYNNAFLAEYEGRGAEKYKTVSRLITERVTDFEEVFRVICESLVNPTLQNFEDMDKYLDEQNESMLPTDEAQGGDVSI